MSSCSRRSSSPCCFVSILMHELAHALVARRYRAVANRIDIYFFGGLVEFWGPRRTVAQDCAISLAGPLSNLVLGLVALGLLMLVPAPELRTIGGPAMPDYALSIVERALRATAYVNFGLFVVNLLPAFPLDGGRVVYLLAEQRWGRTFATLLVSSTGLFFATVSIVVLSQRSLPAFRCGRRPHSARTGAPSRQRGAGRAAGTPTPHEAPEQLPRKRLAQIARAFHPETPRQVGSFGDPNPHAFDDFRFFRTRPQFEGRLVERQAILRARDAERLAQPARAGAKKPLVCRCRAVVSWSRRLRVGSSARMSTALAEPSPSQTKFTHQWMP